jgi:hypothetical protein
MKTDDNWANKNVELTFLSLIVLYVGGCLIFGMKAVTALFFIGMMLGLLFNNNFHMWSPLYWFGILAFSQVINFGICYGLISIVRRFLKSNREQRNNAARQQ